MNTEHDSTPDKGKQLTSLARAAIARRLGRQTASPASTLSHPDWLDQSGAAFITLTHKGGQLEGQLRGCIGSLEAHRPLIQDIEANAQAAAFRDPRFPPLTAEELDAIRVEVSILTPPQPMQFVDEADALRQLRPNIDGVILEHGPHRATFLPQVWEQLPEPRAFMAHLKVKAGLSANFWADDIRLSCYQVEKFKEV